MYTRFYDQVLTEIEVGQTRAGINLLVGMLDTVGLQPGSLAQAREEPRDHSLGQMLLQDPLCADAQALPNNPSGRIAMISDKRAGADVSSTGHRLFEATSDLTFARALRGRRDGFDQRLKRAWQTGRRICLLGSGSVHALELPAGGDISNITVIDPDAAACALESAAAAGVQFDLILAPDLADSTNSRDLSALLGLMRPCLTEGGSIVVAALLPHHIGAGWRRACMIWEPDCHDEQGLERLASAAGLSPQTYRDETNCVVWAELTVASCAQQKGE